MSTFKSILRIPTAEQYSYIEIEMEGTPQAIVDAHREFSGLVKPQPGLSPKEFNAFLDQYITDATGQLETYNAMSEPQKAVIQELKKAFKRLKSRNQDHYDLGAAETMENLERINIKN